MVLWSAPDASAFDIALKGHLEQATVASADSSGKAGDAALTADAATSPAKSDTQPSQSPAKSESAASDAGDASKVGRSLTKALQKAIKKDESSQWASPVADVTQLRSIVEMEEMVRVLTITKL